MDIDVNKVALVSLPILILHLQPTKPALLSFHGIEESSIFKFAKYFGCYVMLNTTLNAYIRLNKLLAIK
jgi:hypothetical protein